MSPFTFLYGWSGMRTVIWQLECRFASVRKTLICYQQTLSLDHVTKLFGPQTLSKAYCVISFPRTHMDTTHVRAGGLDSSIVFVDASSLAAPTA